MDTICTQVSDNAIEEVLERIPKDMNAIYEGILSTIDKKSQGQRELARRVLICVAYSRSPIPVSLLAQAISVSGATQTPGILEFSIPTPAVILDACAGLISIESNTQNVQFVHFSVQEFLTSYQSKSLKRLEIGYELGHTEIARMFITLLSILHAQSSQLLVDYTALERYHKHLNILNEWPHHLLAANLNELPPDHQMIKLASSFFEKKPPIFVKYCEWSNRAVYFGFSPAVLALIFNLPHSHPRPLSMVSLEKERLRSIYGIEQSTVIFNDNFAMHYATSVLNSIPVAQRLYSHGYPIDYSYDSSNHQPSTPQYNMAPSDSIRLPLVFKYTPLYYVTNEKIAEFLLDNGASVEPHIMSGESVDPLKFFATSGNSKVTQLLLDRVVDIHGARHEEALRTVIREGTQGDVIQILLNKSVNPYTQHIVYSNLLETAASSGNVKAMQLLLRKGAGVNFQGGYYGNALQAAAYYGNVEAVRFLLDKGADIHAQGGEYGNALQAAAYMNQPKAMRLLLDKGADVNAQGGYYGSAVQAAA